MPTAGEVEVRTLHALARQVLLDAAHAVELVADRLPLLRAARRWAAALPGEAAVPEASVLDTLLSAWKIEGRAPPPEAETALAAYESLLAPAPASTSSISSWAPFVCSTRIRPCATAGRAAFRTS